MCAHSVVVEDGRLQWRRCCWYVCREERDKAAKTYLRRSPTMTTSACCFFLAGCAGVEQDVDCCDRRANEEGARRDGMGVERMAVGPRPAGTVVRKQLGVHASAMNQMSGCDPVWCGGRDDGAAIIADAKATNRRQSHAPSTVYLRSVHAKNAPHHKPRRPAPISVAARVNEKSARAAAAAFPRRPGSHDRRHQSLFVRPLRSPPTPLPHPPLARSLHTELAPKADA